MNRRSLANQIRGSIVSLLRCNNGVQIKSGDRRNKCTIDNTRSDADLKWKTTKDSYCEYILTAEEEKQQKENHFRIISNSNINIDNDLISRSIKKYKNENMSEYYFKLYSSWCHLKKKNKAFLHLSKYVRTISGSIRTFPWVSDLFHKFLGWKRQRNIHIFISPIYERINNENLFLKFGLNKNDVRHVVYFLCIHIWMYSVKLDKGNHLVLKVLLWEKVWDYYRGLIMKHKISEFSFNTYLINMQEYSLGFCVGLDECINKDFYAGKIHHLLFNHIFNSNEIMKNSQQLMDLTIYCIRMYRFIYHLPDSHFLEARFTWPDTD